MKKRNERETMRWDEWNSMEKKRERIGQDRMEKKRTEGGEERIGRDGTEQDGKGKEMKGTD